MRRRRRQSATANSTAINGDVAVGGGVTGLTERVAVAPFAPDGSAVFVTADGAAGLGAPTAAYGAATGTRLWSVRGNATAPYLAVSPDGSEVFSVGGVTGALATVADNPSTGARLWLAHYPSPRAYSSGIAVSPDGSTVFVIGVDVTLAYNS